MEDEKRMIVNVVGMVIGLPIWVYVARINEAKIEEAPLLTFVYMIGGGFAGMGIAAFFVYGLPAVFSRWTR